MATKGRGTQSQWLTPILHAYRHGEISYHTSIHYRDQLYTDSRCETLDKDCPQPLDTIIMPHKYKSWRDNKGWEFLHPKALSKGGDSRHPKFVMP